MHSEVGCRYAVDGRESTNRIDGAILTRKVLTIGKSSSGSNLPLLSRALLRSPFWVHTSTSSGVRSTENGEIPYDPTVEKVQMTV